MKNLTITLEKVKNKNDIRLKRLLQFYQYDWSEITREGALTSTALYDHIKLNKFWKYPKSAAFIIKVSDEIAGFVMIKKHSYLANQKPIMCIDEFFVMRQYRNCKIGKEVAAKIFNTSPGEWQVAEMSINTGAQKFWRKVIAEYTQGNYREIISDNELWRGPVQIFKSSP